MYRFLVFLMACMALLPMGHANAAREFPHAKLLAVYFYADWCPNCKLLSPNIDKARTDGMLDSKDVLFVKLNFTDKVTIRQSVLLAQALGIEEFVKAQGSATGYMALLDANTKKEITRFDRASSAEKIQTTIEKQLQP